jgi:two-component system cell cycle sensor histidine kinase/response regulator CckA
MKDQYKTKKQLIEELEVLRNQLAKPKKTKSNRKRMEETLRESEERYRQLLEIAPVGIAVHSEGKIVFTNPAGVRLLGAESEEQVIGKPLAEIIPPDRLKQAQSRIKKMMSGEKGLYPVEDVCLRLDGSPVNVEAMAEPLTYKGKPAVQVIVIDITERKQAEEKLKAIYERLNYLLTSTSVAIYTSKTSGDYEATSITDNVKQITGYEPREFIENQSFWIEHVHPEDRKIILNELPRLFKQGTHVYEYRFLHKDGHYGWIRDDMRLITDKRNEPLEIIGYWIDITEHKQAEKALRESEERFRLAFENANTGVCLVDLEGNLTKVNDKMCEIFGYTKEELERMTVNDIAYPEDVNLSPEFIQKTLRGEIDHGMFEKRYFHKKGHVVTCQLSSALVRDASDIPLYFISHLYDITERKQAEEALQKEREISLSILENAPYGVALIDKGSQYIYINPQFTAITGYTLPDIPTGKDWLQKAFPEPKYKEKMIQAWKEDRSRGNIINREFSITCKDGTIREIEIRSTFLRDGRAITVLLDITEQKRSEERMESLQEQLRQSQKMEAIGRLAGGIAHDFNNILTIIKGYSQLSLIQLKEDTPLKGNIVHIHTATDRAADLVRQLLAFSRRQILEMKVLDLNTILRNLHNMLRRLIGEDIEFFTLLAEDLGRVKTDLGWIEQVIMNLVVNAKDAMPSGGKLTIETGNTDLDEAYVAGRVGVKPGRYVMLSVNDTGIGMTPEVTERLFEPFFSTKDMNKGTGLGLSTVYGIVKQSGGDIWVYSELGKGSTFKIYLPRVDEPLEERREKLPGNELLRGSETILLVEDEEELRKLAVGVLERQGYKVLAARDGNEALLICKRHRDSIHLMLTDVVMPGIDGHEVAKRLESLHPETKVLYMSGYMDDAIVLHGVLVEGVNFIQKPFAVDALTNKIREVLEK